MFHREFLSSPGDWPSDCKPEKGEGATGSNHPARFRFCLKGEECQKLSRPVETIIPNLTQKMSQHLSR